MGKRRIFDEDVQEVFSSFGLSVPIFFEALRYRQQLNPNKSFRFKSADIKKMTGLSYKQQLRARRILETADWIRAHRGEGNVIEYRLTARAKDLIKHTPRRRDLSKLKQNLVKAFS